MEDRAEKEDKAENTDRSKRAQRVGRIKKLIVALVVLACVLPAVFSLLMLDRLSKLDRRLTQLESLLVQTVVEAPQPTSMDTKDLAAAPGETGERAYVAQELPETSLPAGEEALTEDELTERTDGDISEGDTKTGIKKVYLTFDDGPSVYTDRILDILAEYDVKATFFVNGHNGYDAQLLRIVREGHTLGMHSYSHEYKKIYASLDGFAEDLYQIQSFLEEHTGVESRFYRFPGGSSNTVHAMDMKECIDYLEVKDIVYFDWNVSGGDALGYKASAEQIVNNVVSQVMALDCSEAVVLLHDTAAKETTVEALPAMIERLKAMDGVEILPITESTEPVQHVNAREVHMELYGE
ncbi:MAG: polysaccharide deacetylase [Lachnospiraceae bacterium]|nr:polysaccharide deacetylase [Lachnospiraceae bacterium]